MAGVLGGCKKDDDTPPPTIPTSTTATALIQKIGRVDGSDTTIYIASYGGDSTVDSFRIYWGAGLVNSYTKRFLHSNTFIRAEQPFSGGAIQEDTFNLDATGKPIRWAQARPPTAVAIIARHYVYDAMGQLIITRQPGHLYSDTIRHTWAAGDHIMSIGEQGDTTRYTYDLSKPTLPGDAWQISELISRGRNRTTSAHLRMSMRDSTGVTTNYQYTYDSVGRIVRMRLIGTASPREYFYEY